MEVSMFKNEINPYSVSDKVTFRNVDKTLTLYVRSNPGMIVSSLRQAQEKIRELNDGSSDCEKINAARFFAKCVFGEEQADRMIDFYNDPLAVISAVGLYFEKQLAQKITKAQKMKK
jgi:hypothetical protein